LLESKPLVLTTSPPSTAQPGTAVLPKYASVVITPTLYSSTDSSELWIAEMKPGKLATRLACSSDIEPELSMTNRKSTLPHGPLEIGVSGMMPRSK
jgi:hypothetical protein